MSKHTPGPWKASTYKEGGFSDNFDELPERYCVNTDFRSSGQIKNGPEATICQMPIDQWATDCSGPFSHRVTSEEMKANAQLIAAAPDLFAALEATELAEDTWANCIDCENRCAEAPESGCERCFNFADKARIMRRAVIAKVKGEKPAPILRLEGAQPN